MKAHPYTKHGQWLPWLEKMGYDDRTAQRLMQLSVWIDSNAPHVAYLPLDQDKLATLTRLETPQDVQKFFDRAGIFHILRGMGCDSCPA